MVKGELRANFKILKVLEEVRIKFVLVLILKPKKLIYLLSMSEDKREGVESKSEFTLTIKPKEPAECDVEALADKIKTTFVLEGATVGTYGVQEFGFGIKFLLQGFTTIDSKCTSDDVSKKLIELFDEIDTADIEY
eukprot:TRINITY_DN366_c0_g1_i1.p1 TRINITY_DN366_c0_g1~~TRINITY_DN366_c0_g1_i1.p1  ORF type:complete len:136 (-),score=35.77 TRINITY_DN366_c0_g1_i1:183-590(-)